MRVLRFAASLDWIELPCACVAGQGGSLLGIRGARTYRAWRV